MQQQPSHIPFHNSTHASWAHISLPLSMHHLSLLLLSSLLLFHHASTTTAREISVEFLFPNFTASDYLYIDNQGVFLTSKNGVFEAAMYNPQQQQSSFYFSVLHKPTATLLWAANRAGPVSDSGVVILTSTSLTVSDQNGTVVWSTPKFNSAIASLQLLDTGNLRLLDGKNSSLWQSFDNPTDTIVSSQLLRVGSYLSSIVSDQNLAEGDYNLSVTSSDAILTWFGSKYWGLSNDVRSIQDSNTQVSSMVLNTTGLNLLSSDGTLVSQVALSQSEFRILKLGSDGKLKITSYTSINSSSGINGDFIAPSDNCNLPNICNSLGLCSDSGNSSTCTCPSQFAASQNGSCLPGDNSTLVSSLICENLNPSVSIQYLSLQSGIGYFSTKYETPTTSDGDLSTCRNLCSKNCTCKGFFYDNSSFSCYLLEKNRLGSLFSSSSVSNLNGMGFIKTLVGSVPVSRTANSSSGTHTVTIVLPSIAAFLLITVIGYFTYGWCEKKRGKKLKSKSKSMKELHLGRHKSSQRNSNSAGQEEEDWEDILIPGLPTRFTYTEIETMTNNFETKIGSGGFGAVFKGELPDKSLVAVKRIEGVGLQGRKEFCTEIAVIGNIRHINLVRLRGFCAQGSRRLLVYEYMNRGSLDRPLFGQMGPILEWGERVEIALGAARGLAYLHNSCDHKIVHCDVKPENILLADGGQVKISDFGLAKLMGPDQSALFTTMCGTRGYLAPEWLTNAAISDRADVYGFGMVLLELVRGRKNRSERSNMDRDGVTISDFSTDTIDSVHSRVEYFPLLALQKHEERSYIDLADPRLEGRVTSEEVGLLVRIALCCLHEEPGLRPNMQTVVRMIEGTVEVWEPRLESLNFLRLYGSGFALATNGFALPTNFTIGSVTSSSNAVSLSPSYMSSQQISGPR
ncbi:hypothetical protein LUZ60_002753 [Juncus effusus]|nr:hypothetical protein LUZ60_002753 [Juncus effusus]